MPVGDARLKEHKAPVVEHPPARNQAQPAPAARLELSQLSAPMLMRLQRLAGNGAVANLLQRPGPASLQRVTVGFEGAEADSWNKDSQTVNAKGQKAAAG